MEGFESCLSEVLLKLRESGLGFTLKREQELATRHLFNGIDVMAVLPTGLKKGYFFSCLSRCAEFGEDFHISD